MLASCVVVAVMMFGFGYALVPMYKQICEVTGINMLTPKDGRERSTNTQVDTSRTDHGRIRCQCAGLPWRSGRYSAACRCIRAR